MENIHNELERIMDMMTEEERDKWERVERIPCDEPRFAKNSNSTPCGDYCYEKKLNWKDDSWNGHTGMHLMLYLRHQKADTTDRVRAVLGLCDQYDAPQSNIWLQNRDDVDYWVPQYSKK